MRYLAPEVLDGHILVTDLSNSLIQIDMYAMALVLWEIATRCVFEGLFRNIYCQCYRNRLLTHPMLIMIIFYVFVFIICILFVINSQTVTLPFRLLLFLSLSSSSLSSSFRRRLYHQHPIIIIVIIISCHHSQHYRDHYNYYYFTSNSTPKFPLIQYNAVQSNFM